MDSRGARALKLLVSRGLLRRQLHSRPENHRPVVLLREDVLESVVTPATSLSSAVDSVINEAVPWDCWSSEQKPLGLEVSSRYSGTLEKVLLNDIYSGHPWENLLKQCRSANGGTSQALDGESAKFFCGVRQSSAEKVRAEIQGSSGMIPEDFLSKYLQWKQFNDFGQYSPSIFTRTASDIHLGFKFDSASRADRRPHDTPGLETFVTGQNCNNYGNHSFQAFPSSRMHQDELVIPMEASSVKRKRKKKMNKHKQRKLRRRERHKN